MNRVWEKKAYWIGGTVTALAGLALLKLLAPELAGLRGQLAGAAGYVLVLIGIMVMACATRRDRAFIAIQENARSDRPDAGSR